MVDLEAMGTNPNAPIVAIGAVFFDPATGDLGPDFYRVVTLKSEFQMGAKPNADTIYWWLTQSDAARRAITEGERLHIVDALSQLTEFVTDYSTESGLNRLQLWGNGASFDPVILRSAYARCNFPEFWKYWNDQDVRTIVALGRVIGFDPKRDHPFAGERHHALADAIHQAQYVSAIWQRLLAPHQDQLSASALHAVYAAGYNHGHLNTADGIAYQNDVESEFEHRALEVIAETGTLRETK
ncbi:3'-5' exonuclease [Komagataeibacter europaeus]|nr:3'-5' exonuclease [Komagataeibacter europaeus]